MGNSGSRGNPGELGEFRKLAELREIEELGHSEIRPGLSRSPGRFTGRLGKLGSCEDLGREA